MLIYNREEVENSYKVQDNEILQIESSLSLKEFTQKLRAGELRPEEYEIHLFRAGTERRVSYLETNRETYDASLYTHIFDPENENGRDCMTRKRDTLYEEFERFTYGQNHDFIEIGMQNAEAGTATANNSDFRLPNSEFLLFSCYDALGIMPCLYEETELSIKEMQDMSYEGNNLYFPWENLTRSNRLPTAEDLKLFHALSPYEKAVLLDSHYNPTRVLDLLHALKSTRGQETTIITKEMVNRLLANGNLENETLVREHWAKQPLFAAIATQEDYARLETAFKQAFGRPPRVLPEIYDAYRQAFGKGEQPFAEEEISQIVKEFSLNNVKKVAAFHNEALLLLSGKYNFDTMKKEHMQIFATYLSPSSFPTLEQNGFFTWYEKYKGQIKTSDLHTLMRRDPSTVHFNLELSPSELLNRDGQVRGWCNAACVYEQYGIDFRDAIVAIPNRGLVVEDKIQHIRMYILDKKDARVFTVGQDCHCCQNLAVRGDQTYGNYYSGDLMKELLAQHFSTLEEAYAYVHEHYENSKSLITPGAGGSCVANELTNPFCWVTIWEDTVTGNTVAQADTHYIPETNTLVYDNIEYVNDGNVKKLNDVIAKYAEESTFDSIHIGVGYNSGMKDFGKRIATAEMQDYKKDVTEAFRRAFGDHVYSDYHADAMKIKQMDKKTGESKLLVYPKKGDGSFKIIRHPEDNAQFRHLLHPLTSLFPDYSYEQKDDLLARYESQNLTVQEMETVAAKKPELLQEIETLPLSVQQAILYPAALRRGASDTGAPVMDMNGFKYIKHPDSLLMSAALEQSPSAILYFDREITTRAHWLSVLERDGSLIEYCPLEYRDEELLTVAIKNNPYAIKYIAHDLEEPLRSKMIRLAVFKKPVLTAHFPDLPEYVWIKICEGKGQFGKFCQNQTYRIQQAMIQSSPYNIDYIHTPDKRIVEAAMAQIPSLRYNPRYAAYFQDSAPRQAHRSNRPEYAQEQEALQELSRQTIPSHTSSRGSHTQVGEEFSLDEIA